MRQGRSARCRSRRADLDRISGAPVAALGAAPVLVLVERLPVALNEAFERLRGKGIAVVAVGDGVEAASRFEAGSHVLLIADGLRPT